MKNKYNIVAFFILPYHPVYPDYYISNPYCDFLFSYVLIIILQISTTKTQKFPLI